MSKSLYNEDHRYTPDADELDALTIQALRDIFNRYADKGFSPREISHIMKTAVGDLELDRVLQGVK